MVAINQKVQTPLGEGFVQGAFAILEAKTEEPISRGIAVRLPVNDMTRPHLNQSNCMTSHATVSGVWVFQESEIK